MVCFVVILFYFYVFVVLFLYGWRICGGFGCVIGGFREVGGESIYFGVGLLFICF